MSRSKPQEPAFVSAAGMPCPRCGRTDTAHSGMMFQELPMSERLDPAVEMLRCLGCHTLFRADGVPYDDEAIRAAWAAHREEMARGTIWP